MEAIGLAASIASLFQAALEGYRIWDAYRNMAADSTVVLNMLMIEEVRFKLWGEKWGLESGSGERFLASFGVQPTVLELVNKTLGQLEILFARSRKWRDRLEPSAVSGVIVLNAEAQSQTGNLIVQQATKKSGKWRLERILGRSSKRINSNSTSNESGSSIQRTDSASPRLANQIKWALPAGKDEFEHLINQIRQTTNMLSEITSHQILEEVLSATILSNTKSLEGAMDIANATNDSHSLLKALAEMKRSVMEIDLAVSQERQRPWQRPKDYTFKEDQRLEEWRNKIKKDFWEQNSPNEILADAVTHLEPLQGERSLAKVDRSRILFEWVYNPGIYYGHVNAFPRKELLHKACVSAVAHQLHHIHRTQWCSGLKPWIRTLDCLGYVYDGPKKTFEGHDGSFSYLFVLPSHLQTTVNLRCISLSDILSSPSREPTSQERARLAKSLARTVFGLQVAGLLHKSLKPANVIFFSTAEGTTGQNLTASFPTDNSIIGEPYIVGFENARPTFGNEFSRTPAEPDIYLHPDYASSDQRRSPRHYLESDDIYSLGLVLFEVALWKPLPSIWDEFVNKVDSQNAEEKKEEKERIHDYAEWNRQVHDEFYETADAKRRFGTYILSLAKDLDGVCGEGWSSAVEWCLRDAQQKEFSEGMFFEKVVQVLEALDR